MGASKWALWLGRKGLGCAFYGLGIETLFQQIPIRAPASLLITADMLTTIDVSIGVPIEKSDLKQIESKF